jgi:hypothetical protein
MKIMNDFAVFVGKREPALSVIGSGLFSLALFFYIYTAARTADVGIYPFLNRITYFKQFDYFVISHDVDNFVLICAFIALICVVLKQPRLRMISVGVASAIFLISFFDSTGHIAGFLALSTMPVMFGLLIFDRYSPTKILNQHTNLTARYLIIIGIFLGLLSITSVTLSITGSFEKPPVRNMLYELFILFSSFSPILIILLISYYPVKILLNSVSRILKKPITVEISELKMSQKRIAVCLSLIIIFSIGIYLIPHLESVNPDKQRISVDTPYYVKWNNALSESKNIYEFLDNAFVLQNSGQRPLALITIFSLSKLNIESQSLIEFLPIIFGPALIVVMYFFTRELTKNDIASLLSAFLTSVSYHAIGGIYAGYYANWLALIVGYASLVLLFKFLKNPTKRLGVTFGSLSIVLLFTHSYTWVIFIIVIVAFLLVQFKLNSQLRKRILFLFLILSASIIIDVVRFAATDTQSGLETEYEIGITEGRIDVHNFSNRWGNLFNNTAIILGGQVGNFIFLGLCLWWAFRSDIHLPRNIFLGVFFSVGLLPILLGTWGIQNRLLYDIPFQIPAAIILTQIKTERKMNGFVILVLVWLIAIAIRSLSNFHLISQS